MARKYLPGLLGIYPAPDLITWIKSLLQGALVSSLGMRFRNHHLGNDSFTGFFLDKYRNDVLKGKLITIYSVISSSNVRLQTHFMFFGPQGKLF